MVRAVADQRRRVGRDSAQQARAKPQGWDMLRSTSILLPVYFRSTSEEQLWIHESLNLRRPAEVAERAEEFVFRLRIRALFRSQSCVRPRQSQQPPVRFVPVWGLWRLAAGISLRTRDHDTFEA